MCFDPNCVAISGTVKMSNELSLKERRLVCELAIGMARRIEAVFGDGSDRSQGIKKSDYVYHGHQTPFERGCERLWSLGLAQGVLEGSSGGQEISLETYRGLEKPTFPRLFKFMNPEEMRRHMTTAPIPGDLELEDVLVEYLSLVSHYGGLGAQLSAERDPFTPQAEFSDEIAALLMCGYLEKAGLDVQWTDRTSEAMFDSGLWTLEGEHRWTIEETEREKLCIDALAKCPELTKQYLIKEVKDSACSGFVMRASSRTWTRDQGYSKNDLYDQISSLFSATRFGGSGVRKPHDMEILKTLSRVLSTM